MQLGHALATLANNAVVMKPHIVQAIEDPVTRKRTPTVAAESYRIPVKQEWIDLVKSAMVDVNKFGTSRMAFVGAEYTSAGKTGTAQVIGIKQGEKYVASRIAERFRDHSLFVAFAPAENPRIAIALIVENGGFGAQAAAPIARKAFDYYLLGKLPKETDVPFPQRDDVNEAEMRDVPESIEPEPLVPGDSAQPGDPIKLSAPAPAGGAPAPASGPTPAPAQVPAPAPAGPVPAVPANPVRRP